MKKKNSFFKNNKLYSLLEIGTAKSAHQIIPFAIFSIIGFILFYFLNIETAPDSYENLPLRILAAVLCIPLILKNNWPEKLKKYLPIYWYLSLLYFLPFFFFYMTFKNNFSPEWRVYTVQLIFFLALLVDWISLIVLIPIGFLIAFGMYLLTTADPISLFNQNFSFIALSFSILLLALFSRNNQVIEREKLQTMKSLSANIAHELRTPLRTINSSVSGIKEYLPILLKAYQTAKTDKIDIPYISPMHFEALLTACDNIESESKSAFTIIDMMLTNVSQSQISTAKFRFFSIHEIISETIKRYPFDYGEAEIVHWGQENDFMFRGDDLLMTHVLFNLFKNALYYIKAAGKGQIYIWTEKTKRHELHFKDTGQGISPKILPNIFDRFYSKTLHGSGIGLAFCKMVMQSFKGDIKCFSEEGKFTEFVLYFPKRDEDQASVAD